MTGTSLKMCRMRSRLLSPWRSANVRAMSSASCGECPARTRLRETSGDALHLGDGQRFARVEAVGIELGAAIEVSGDDEHVAAHLALACGRKPVGAAMRDELDEIVIVGGQRLLQDLALVIRIDGDGANR